MELFEIIGQGDQIPFNIDLIKPPKQKLTKPQYLFDDAGYR